MGTANPTLLRMLATARNTAPNELATPQMPDTPAPDPEETP